MPKKLTAKEYALALYDSVQETRTEDHNKLMDTFVKILAENGDLNLYDLIETEFRLLDLKDKGIAQVEITQANSAKTNPQLLVDLNRIIGEKLELTQKVDQKILGGVIVRVDDTLIDASIKTQLENLSDTLKK